MAACYVALAMGNGVQMPEVEEGVEGEEGKREGVGGGGWRLSKPGGDGGTVDVDHREEERVA